MNTYIALFRGINVGGKHILSMKDLVEIFNELGCEKVRTYIQSGNVVFQRKNKPPENLAGKIISRISEQYGFKPKVLMFDLQEFKKAIDNNPFKTENGKTLHFFFLDSIPNKPDLEKLMAVKSKSEEFKLRKNIFYLYAPDGIGRSKLVNKIEQCLGVPVTGRNWNTISKLFSIARQV